MDNKKYVLIAEDEATTARLLESILLANDYEVNVVPNGQLALKALQKRAPDVIISDVVMPGMDGYTFYKELKKNPAIANIPVIILTARTKMEDTFAVLGVDEFLVKPFQTEILLEKVKLLVLRGKASSLVIEMPDVTPVKKAAAPVPWLYFAISFFILLVVGALVLLVRSVPQKPVIHRVAVSEGDLSVEVDPEQEKIAQAVLANLEFR